MSTLRMFTSFSAVAIVSLTTSSVMALSQIPSGTEPPMPNAVLVWVDVETGNLTIYIDSSGGDDADKLSDLEIQWWETEGGFITENCLNLDGPFDVCTPNGLFKMASMGSVLDLGNVFPPETQPCDLMETLRVDGHYLTGGGLQKYDGRSPYINCPHITGDYNNDGVLDGADLNLQAMRIMHVLPVDLSYDYDLNDDGVVDYRDRQIWVNDLKNTWIGDANLDLEFNSGDFVQVFVAGKNETGQTARWEEGDWNGDMKFNSGDFVASFDSWCGYEHRCQRPKPVPEPTGVRLLVIGVLGLINVCRRR